MYQSVLTHLDMDEPLSPWPPIPNFYKSVSPCLSCIYKKKVLSCLSKVIITYCSFLFMPDFSREWTWDRLLWKWRQTSSLFSYHLAIWSCNSHLTSLRCAMLICQVGIPLPAPISSESYDGTELTRKGGSVFSGCRTLYKLEKYIGENKEFIIYHILDLSSSKS